MGLEVRSEESGKDDMKQAGGKDRWRAKLAKRLLK